MSKGYVRQQMSPEMTDNSERYSSGRLTLNDVARQAEVSRALVSIVMRDAPGASSATRERVLAAAGELGYRPDVRARSLAGQKSRLIGVMFGVGVGTFHFDLLDGLVRRCRKTWSRLDPDCVDAGT